MVFRIVHSLLWLLSLLPFGILYALSDLIFVVLYHLLGYRRKVVASNLRLAFPERSKTERLEIEKAFYRHLCDLIVESLKRFSMSAEALDRRMEFESAEVIAQIKASEKGTIILGTHYGNFEWTNAVVDKAAGKLPTYAVYQRLSSPLFERLTRQLRSRYGARLIERQQAFRQALSALQEPCMIGFMADQSPAKRKKLFFTPFMGKPTAFHEGPALLAVRRKTPAYFAWIKRKARGHYSCSLIPVPETAYQSQEAFTAWYAGQLEANIRENPPYWLWSHRRWKHNLN